MVKLHAKMQLYFSLDRKCINISLNDGTNNNRILVIFRTNEAGFEKATDAVVKRIIDFVG